MKHGKFIVLEGMHGCGKDVQGRMITEKLKRDGYKAKFTSEPTFDLPIGKLVRDEFLSGKVRSNNVIIGGLIALDRYHQTIDTGERRGTIWELKNGVNIIQSRNYLSSLALDIIDGSDTYNMDYIYNLNKITMDILRPDVLIFIDVSKETYIQRLKMMDNRDVFEQGALVDRNMQNYYNAIDYLKERNSENIVFVDGNQSESSVMGQIMDIIKPLLEEDNSEED